MSTTDDRLGSPTARLGPLRRARGARLTVLVLAAWYPMPDRPAWGIFIRDHVLAAALAHDVVVVAADAREDVKGLFTLDDTIEDGVRTLRVYFRASRVGKLAALGYLLGIRAAVRRLRRQGIRPDLIHAHVHHVGWAAVTLGFLLRRPVIISEHSSEWPRATLDRGLRMRAKLAFRAAAFVCPVSESLRQCIVRQGISARFEVVPNAVDPSFFPATDRCCSWQRSARVLFVAQLVPIKGLRYLLEALAELARSRRDFVLDVVGDGPNRSEYVALASDLGVGDLVAFHGLQPRQTIAQLMRESCFFVLPSLTENQSVALIEAMASGLPVVATRVGGLPEIVGDGAGVLVPPADTGALRHAIEHMLDHHTEYVSDAIARSVRDRFSYEQVGARWNALYADAVGNQRAPRLSAD